MREGKHTTFAQQRSRLGSGQFVKNGGVFNLLVEERKLEIHRGNATKAGLKISSKLLKISKVI